MVSRHSLAILSWRRLIFRPRARLICAPCFPRPGEHLLMREIAENMHLFISFAAEFLPL